MFMDKLTTAQARVAFARIHVEIPADVSPLTTINYVDEDGVGCTQEMFYEWIPQHRLKCKTFGHCCPIVNVSTQKIETFKETAKTRMTNTEAGKKKNENPKVSVKPVNRKTEVLLQQSNNKEGTGLEVEDNIFAPLEEDEVANTFVPETALENQLDRRAQNSLVRDKSRTNSPLGGTPKSARRQKKIELPDSSTHVISHILLLKTLMLQTTQHPPCRRIN